MNMISKKRSWDEKPPPITREEAQNTPVPIPKPALGETRVHLAHASRNEAVAGVVTHVNAVLAYVGNPPLPIPAQSNIDERMPLYFMRPCIIELNKLIKKFDLPLLTIPEIGDSIDYHGVILMANNIINHANRVLELIPDSYP